AAERSSKTEIAGIIALAERFEEVLDRAYGSAAAVAANKDLHFAVYRAAGSETLMQLITMLWLKAGPIINFDIGVEAGLPAEQQSAHSRGHHSRRHHRMLCEALLARDGETAAQAISEDIRFASEFIRAHAGMDQQDSRRRIIS
ncbi:FCD domain-containing protein, partial [Rhodovulum sulfidophilum]